MNELSDELVYKNRRTVIDYLKDPARVKATGILRAREGDGRCCLGHMCDVLETKSVWSGQSGTWMYDGGQDSTAPDSVVNAVGLNTSIGSTHTGALPSGQLSLATTNDNTDWTPQMIGQMLEDMILGGPVTPWREIKI